MGGYLYDLPFSQPPRVRASGLDAAHRIATRLAVAIELELANDREVAEVEARGYIRERPVACDRTRGCKAALHHSSCPGAAR